jgi:hypothetical protein
MLRAPSSGLQDDPGEIAAILGDRPMNEKSNDPGGTHILDEREIEELDELTLTSVIRDASELPEPEPLDDETPDIDDFDFEILSPPD